MIKHQEIPKKELFLQVFIFIGVLYTAIEAPLNFTFSFPLEIWRVILDTLIAIIFFIDLQKELKNNSYKENKISLIIDSICSLPFELIFYIFFQNTHLDILQYLGLIRVLRVSRLIKYIQDIALIPQQIKMTVMISFFYICVHFISCLWMLVENVEGLNNLDRYVKAMYWTLTTLTTIGYGDITPQTMFGRIFTMIIMIMGVGLYGIVIGNVSKVIAQKERYKLEAREKITELNDFMKHYHIPEKLQQNVFSYYNNMLNKRLTQNDQKIINELPQALQHELQIYMNIKLIKNLSLFETCSVQSLKEVAMNLKQVFYAPGHNIINIGDIGSELYIISHGSVEVFNRDGKSIAHLSEGQFFGEMALLEERARNASVVAYTYCDLYKLEKEDFLNVTNNHPELLASIQNVANKRK